MSMLIVIEDSMKRRSEDHQGLTHAGSSAAQQPVEILSEPEISCYQILGADDARIDMKTIAWPSV
jgi:hypothetical protein